MPSIINATTSTGLVSSADNSGSLQLATNNGTTALTIDTSQNVGIGTASPAYKLDVQNGTGRIYNATFPSLRIQNSDTGTGSTDGLLVEMSGSNALFVNYESANMIFSTANTERMRIDSSGNFLVGNTSVGGTGWSLYPTGYSITNGSTSTFTHMSFQTSSSQKGFIQTVGSTTNYNGSSDYRLKKNIEPLSNALQTIAQIKPVKFNWIEDNSVAYSFIAHELQEVVPQAVGGIKDEVDGEGNPVYQGIDPSKLVCFLTAAIQELKAELDATKAEVAALKGAK